MTKITGCILSWFITFSLFAGSANEELSLLVRDLVSLKKEISAEKNHWRQENEQLQRSLSILKEIEKAVIQEDKKVSHEQKRALKDLEKIQQEYKEKKALLQSFNKSLAQSANLLLIEYGKLPIPLKKQLSDNYQLIRRALLKQESDFLLIEKLHILKDFANEISALQKEVHALKEIIKIPETGKEIEVDVIYLGTLLGYYLSPNHQNAGMVIREGNQWAYRKDSTLIPVMEKALKTLSQSQSLEFLRLPFTKGAKR